LREQIDKDDLKDTFGAIEGATDESIQAIQKDIEEFLEEKKPEKKDEKKEDSAPQNPFSALFSGFPNLFNLKKKEDKTKILSPDTELEKVIRSQALIEARRKCDKMYGIFKKMYNMPTM
jgi:hypothetical protein